MQIPKRFKRISPNMYSDYDAPPGSYKMVFNEVSLCRDYRGRYIVIAAVRMNHFLDDISNYKEMHCVATFQNPEEAIMWIDIRGYGIIPYSRLRRKFGLKPERYYL